MARELGAVVVPVPPSAERHAEAVAARDALAAVAPAAAARLDSQIFFHTRQSKCSLQITVFRQKISENFEKVSRKFAKF